MTKFYIKTTNELTMTFLELIISENLFKIFERKNKKFVRRVEKNIFFKILKILLTRSHYLHTRRYK